MIQCLITDVRVPPAPVTRVVGLLCYSLPIIGWSKASSDWIMANWSIALIVLGELCVRHSIYDRITNFMFGNSACRISGQHPSHGTCKCRFAFVSLCSLVPGGSIGRLLADALII